MLERMRKVNTKYKLTYHKSAVKFLAKQDKNTQERISIGLRGLLIIPPVGDIRSLKGYEDLYRLRVGDYRITFTIDYNKKIIYIQAIGNRGNIKSGAPL